MTKERRKSLFTPSRVVFYILSLIVFYLAVQYFSKFKDIQTLLVQMSPGWLVLALVSQIITYLLNALILYTLLQKKPGTASFFMLFKMSVVVIFINQALPSGGLSGIGYVFNQLVKKNVPATKAFTALVLESICFYIAFILLLILFYSWCIQSGVHTTDIITYTFITGIVFYIFLGIVQIIISNRHTISFVLLKLNRFGFIRRYIDKANLPSLKTDHEASMKTFVKNKKTTLLAILLHVGILFFDIITCMAIMKGFKIEMSFNCISLGLLLTLVVGALPLSPGSLIVYESSMTYFFHIFGAPLHAAIIVTLLYRFFTFWLPIPVGLLLYRNLQKSKPIL